MIPSLVLLIESMGPTDRLRMSTVDGKQIAVSEPQVREDSINGQLRDGSSIVVNAAHIVTATIIPSAEEMRRYWGQR